jgi:hypothetical protein
VIDADLYDLHRTEIADDLLLIVKGRIQPDRFNGGVRINVSECWNLNRARIQFAKRIEVNLEDRRPDWTLLSAESSQSEIQHDGLAIRCNLKLDDIAFCLEFEKKLQPSEEKIATLQLMCDLEESKQGVQSSVQIVYQ